MSNHDWDGCAGCGAITLWLLVVAAHLLILVAGTVWAWRYLT